MGATIPADYIGKDPGKISIKFFNGTEVVNGFIVRQTGSRRYVVSQDGETEFTVTLADKPEELSLGDGLATIEIFPYLDGKISDMPAHIHRLEQFTCYTIEGHKLGWRFGKADQIGEGNISQIS